MKYRVFVEDVGRNKFSGVGDAEAATPRKAIYKASAIDPGSEFLPTWYGRKLIALPHSRKDLWPNGKTGSVPREALNFR